LQDSAKGTKRGHTPLLLHDTGGMREMPNVGSTSPSQTGFLRYRIVAADVGVLHQALIGTGRRYLVPQPSTPQRSALRRRRTGQQVGGPQPVISSTAARPLGSRKIKAADAAFAAFGRLVHLRSHACHDLLFGPSTNSPWAPAGRLGPCDPGSRC
jgi:hypothetical protein